MTDTNRTRFRFEKGLAACSKELISGRLNALTRAMQQLLFTSDADRIYLFENFVDSKSRLSLRQTHEICAHGIQGHQKGPYLEHAVYDEHAPGWRRVLEKGESLISDLDSADEPEKELFKTYGTIGLLLIPVFIGTHWYGFIGFDDVKKARKWDEQDVRLLKTAAEMIGTFVEKEFYISALIKSEERYRSIIENINEGYFEVDLKGRFTFVNKKLCKMHRRSRKKMLTLNYTDYTDPDTAELMKKTYKEIYRTGVPSRINEYHILRKDNTIATHEHSVSLIEDGQGAIKGFRGIVRDTGEFKEQEKTKKELDAKCFQVQKLESIATLAGGLAMTLTTF